MRLGARAVWLAGFTAAFAVLAAFVFWGTWSPDFAPVMPDCAITHPRDYVARWFADFLSNGKFSPVDLLKLIDPYFLQEFQYALSLYCAALGMALLCRSRGLSRLASYGAGLLLAFSGYWITLFSAGHLGWFQWMSCGVFAFALADRAAGEGRMWQWAALGAAVAWASFNQQDMWLLFTVFTGAYLVYRLVCERKFPWKGMLLSAAVFFAIGLPNFIETLTGTIGGRKAQMESFEKATADKPGDGADKRWEFVTNWSMPPEDTLEFFVPRVHGDTSCPFVQSIVRQSGRDVKPYVGRLGRPMGAAAGNYRQHSLYVGRVTCILALVALLWPLVARLRGGSAAKLPRGAGFFAVAGLVFYALSLGRFFEPAYRVVFALPFGDLIRCPVKWHHLTEFCIVVLAAYGIEALLSLRWFGTRAGTAVLIALVSLGALDLAVEAHRYCAPVNVSAARRGGELAELTVIGRNDFSNPQVAEMVRRGKIVSVASYLGNPAAYVVEVLRPHDRQQRRETSPMTVVLGILSIIATVATTICCVCAFLRRRSMV